MNYTYDLLRLILTYMTHKSSIIYFNSSANEGTLLLGNQVLYRCDAYLI
jgi:hypothetical protein